MKKTLFSVIAVAVLAALLLSGTVFAQGLSFGQAGCLMLGGKWWHDVDYAKKLALTDKEKLALDNLYSENAKGMIDSQSTLQKDALAISQLIDIPNMDDEAVLAKFKEHKNTMDTMRTEHFKYLLEIRKLLGVVRFQQLRALNNCGLGYGMGSGRGSGKGMGRDRGTGRGTGMGMGRGLNPYCPLNMQ
jgi:Spy/CpxP family protein refolding chaperone